MAASLNGPAINAELAAPGGGAGMGVASRMATASLEGRAASQASRAAELHAAHDPIATNMRTTAVGGTSGGRTLVTTSTTKTPQAGVRAAGGKSEVMVSAARGRASDHAEIKAINAAAARGETLTTLGVTRIPCPNCSGALNQEGTTFQVQRP
jgi:hypothetical protein